MDEKEIYYTLSDVFGGGIQVMNDAEKAAETLKSIADEMLNTGNGLTYEIIRDAEPFEMSLILHHGYFNSCARFTANAVNSSYGPEMIKKAITKAVYVVAEHLFLKAGVNDG
jgi:hypothetical protein